MTSLNTPQDRPGNVEFHVPGDLSVEGNLVLGDVLGHPVGSENDQLDPPIATFQTLGNLGLGDVETRSSGQAVHELTIGGTVTVGGEDGQVIHTGNNGPMRVRNGEVVSPTGLDSTIPNRQKPEEQEPELHTFSRPAERAEPTPQPVTPLVVEGSSTPTPPTEVAPANQPPKTGFTTAFRASKSGSSFADQMDQAAKDGGF